MKGQGELLAEGEEVVVVLVLLLLLLGVAERELGQEKRRQKVLE